MMLLSVLSGLIVSVDAFFIGLSLGLQKRCRFLYLVFINIFLLGLCVLGFFIAERLYAHIIFDTDLIVGFSFIALGLWTILHCFLSVSIKRRANTAETGRTSLKSVALVGFVMSGEAMLITMGITFIFLPHSTVLIPISVSFAHFGYSALSFYLTRTKYGKRIPTALSHIISGLALITYGLMALFVELGI